MLFSFAGSSFNTHTHTHAHTRAHVHTHAHTCTHTHTHTRAHVRISLDPQLRSVDACLYSPALSLTPLCFFLCKVADVLFRLLLGTPASQKGVAPDDRVSPAGHTLRQVLLSQLLRSPRAAVTYPAAYDAVRHVCVDPGIPLRHQVLGLQFCHRCCELGTAEQLDAGGVGALFATLLLTMLEDPSINAELQGLA
jgi:hypothetical protein